MSCIKTFIVSAAVVAPAIALFGCSEDNKGCSDLHSKARCKKGKGKKGKNCQWKPANGGNATCSQNHTVFDGFFNFADAADYFYHQHLTKNITIHELDVHLVMVKGELAKAKAKKVPEVGRKLHKKHRAVAFWEKSVDFVLMLIDVKKRTIEVEVSAVNETSKKVYDRCHLANGSWRRQFEDAQRDQTDIYPVDYQRFIDEYDNLYGKKNKEGKLTFSFKSFLKGDGAIARDYFRVENGQVKMTVDPKDAKKKIITLIDGTNEYVVENEKDWNRFGIVLSKMSDKCHKAGGLVTVNKEYGAECVDLPKYLRREQHADSIDDEYHCEEANKRATAQLYPNSALPASDMNGVKPKVLPASDMNGVKPKVDPPKVDPPKLFQWEGGRCNVVKPCEMIWESISSANVTMPLHPHYKYCKAKLDLETEGQDVQCFDISRLDSACMADNDRKLCTYWDGQTPAELEIGAGMCQFANASAGTCHDFVNHAATKKAASKKVSKVKDGDHDDDDHQ